MIATIEPSEINGTIKAPSSKSAMQRACALALLNNGETIIQNTGNSNDELVALGVVKQLGADVHKQDENLLVRSTGCIVVNGPIDCGESGLSLRMFAPIAALSDSPVLLNGSSSLMNRPMHFIDEIFPLLNTSTKSNNGFLPITVTGPLLPANISIDGSDSSQYLTGLLFAFAAAAKQLVSIHVTNLKSKPYIDLSLKMLAHFGYDVGHDNYTDFYIRPIEKKETSISYYTEADWSSASFLLVAGAIAGEIHVSGLDIHSVQADRAILQVLERCDADITIMENRISVTNRKKLHAFQFDATDCPDLFPPLVALAACCSGTSVIKGVSRLAFKESNRAESLVDVFTKMGIELFLRNDEMIILGTDALRAATVSPHHDHRIAMAAAVAGLRANGKVIIRDAEVVNKSYPDFYKHLRILGVAVTCEDALKV